MKTHVERISNSTPSEWWVSRDLPNGGDQYLHKDGTWHKTTNDDLDTESFPGLFKSEQEAREVLSHATN